MYLFRFDSFLEQELVSDSFVIWDVSDWVKACWDGHFLDLTPLPLVTDNLLQEEGYCTEQLEFLHVVAKQWQNSQTHTEGKAAWHC